MIASPQQTDVAVIGGGPAGTATALALAAAGTSVVLIEREQYTGWKIGEGLPPACKPILQQLGVWERFRADGHLPSYGNVSIWGSSERAEQSFIFDPNGHGWHLERQRFDAMLARAAIEAGTFLRVGMAVIAADRTVQENWDLLLRSDDGAISSMQARFVVDASGRSSWFATRHGAHRINDDGLVGVATRLVADRDVHDQEASTFVEAVRDGWWYAAPVPDGRLVVAYMSDGNLPTTRTARSASAWLALLSETLWMRDCVAAFGYRIEIGSRVFAANSAHLDNAVGTSWLAIGDAAIAFDPLSSQGILTALTAGLRAARTIRAYLKGESGALDRYADFIHQTYADYFKNRAEYYAIEQRWPASPFWQRRHTPRVYP